jgi:hypothetical protein
MSDTQTLVPLREASSLFPGHPHLSTLRRWREQGVCGQKLETVRVGNRLFVSQAAADAFIRSCSSGAESGS